MTIPPADLAQADLITAALDAIVDAVATVGLPVTRDPGDFQPPGVIVQPPTVTGAATLQTIGLAIPVEIVADQPGRAGVDWALACVTVLLPVFGETLAEPVTWSSPINPNGLPAYLITVRANVAQEGTP